MSYLSDDDKPEVISFLPPQPHFSVEPWRDHLETQYQVVYKSKPSYYQLLDEGGLSWKKNGKVNSKRDEVLVVKTQKSIRNKINRRQPEIHDGNWVVLMIDECH